MTANFHTHSTFCDGVSTPRETVLRALELGFDALGFTGHSFTDFDPCGMDEASAAAYRAEIARLRTEYAGRLEIYCGVEQDWFSGRAAPEYDYAIGSVHYVLRRGEHLCVDWSIERTRENIEKFGGDPYAYAEEYFAMVGSVAERTGAQIVGHFDLLRKFDGGEALFDEDEPRYRRAVLRALERLCAGGKRPVFEINTGAVARGLRSEPYPSPWILRRLRERRCPVMITSDCHDRALLDRGYAGAAALARQAGYTEQMAIKNGKFTPIPL